MKNDNPKNWNNPFELKREGDQVSVWLPPVDHPEGECLCTFNTYYVPGLIAALKKFEQSEGRG